MPHGAIGKLATKVEELTGAPTTRATISFYLRGMVDEDNEEVVNRANQVREIALKMGGVLTN